MNKGQKKSYGKVKKNTSKGRGFGKGKKGGKMEARPEENRKVESLQRSGDPNVCQSHGRSNDARLAIAVRLPEHQETHLLLQPHDPLR